MRQITIEKQIRAIDRAAEIASKSKESALKFLRDAGIISTKNKAVSKSKQKKQQL